jgi:hypothetical protein
LTVAKARAIATAARIGAISFAVDSEISRAAIGRKRFFGCWRSSSTSSRSLT